MNEEEIKVINWSKKEEAKKKLEQEKIFKDLGVQIL